MAPASERRPIRVLFVEDSSEDVELALRALRGAGFEPTHQMVDTAEALTRALHAATWDVIIADYAMPAFTGLEALRLVQQAGLDVPFLLVSGTVGEDVAVEAMRAGAQDYVLKDKLLRLPLAVLRELREAEGRGEKRRVERMQRFVADVSAALVESIDYETTVRRVAGLIASEIADFCVIELCDRSGRLERTAVAHRDPSHAALAESIERDYTDPADAARARALERLGATSSITMPLEARGQSLGALTLVSCDPQHLYVESEVELARELSRRVAIAVDNARLYREAQQAVALRDEFIAVASHELKTPTFAVVLQLEGLLEIVRQLGGDVDPRLEPRLGRATLTMGRVSRLVESLLDVSRLSAGKLELERSPIDLVLILRHVVDRVREQAEAAGSPIRVLADGPVEGRWDRLRLEQVFGNLLSNAVKYGAGKPIEVSVRRETERAVVEVRDHGIGVRSEDVDRIFARFERAVPLQHYGGLGLGLYIARQLVAAHGGDMAVKDTPGGGATFRVELPPGTDAGAGE